MFAVNFSPNRTTPNITEITVSIIAIFAAVGLTFFSAEKYRINATRPMKNPDVDASDICQNAGKGLLINKNGKNKTEPTTF